VETNIHQFIASSYFHTLASGWQLYMFSRRPATSDSEVRAGGKVNRESDRTPQRLANCDGMAHDQSEKIHCASRRRLSDASPLEHGYPMRTSVALDRARLCVAFLAAFLALAGTGHGGKAWAQVRQYRIEPQASAVRVLVYRKGVLSVLAHDHVLVAKEVQGRIAVDGGDIGRSTVILRVGAAAFEVDAPAERQKAGFVSELTDGNRQSILDTMIGPEVLNTAKWPVITAASEKVSGRLPDLRVEMRVKIRDREQVLSIPMLVTVSPARLTASGSVAFEQSAFGMVPYETLFGAIAVQDKIVVRFDIVAVPQT